MEPSCPSASSSKKRVPVRSLITSLTLSAANESNVKNARLRREAMPSWRPVRTRRKRRARRVSIAFLLGIALIAAEVGVIVWNRHEGGNPPAQASPRPIGNYQKPKIVRRRLARAGPLDLYAHDHAGMVSAVARRDPARIYVPNSAGDSVDVIDPRTYKVVEHFPVGALPQHVTPSHDLKTLYVNDDVGNTLTPIDPLTGRPGKPFPVDDPYNLYFTIDGRYAIVVAERLHRLDFRDAHTFRLHRSLAVPCTGVDHMDFSADGRYAIASCEFSGQLLKVDIARE